MSALILVIAGSAILAFLATAIKPILLPVAVKSMLTSVFAYVWSWDGIIPVESWFQDLKYIIWVTTAFIIFKLVIGIVALGTGGGKPEL